MGSDTGNDNMMEDMMMEDEDHPALTSEFDAIEFGDNNNHNQPDIYGRQKDVDVIGELKAICLEYESTSPIENLAIELNSFKFSQNASYSDCTMAAILAILEKMNITQQTSDVKMLKDFKALLEEWSPLLQKMSIGQAEEMAIV